MKYTKPALSLVEQADLLISRGMLGDREQIIRQLSAVNGYLLEGDSLTRFSALGSKPIVNRVRSCSFNRVSSTELVMLKNGLVRGGFVNNKWIGDKLHVQIDKSTKLGQTRKANLGGVGYGG
jgi:hypothetical protein